MSSLISEDVFVKMIVCKDSGINEYDAKQLYWSMALSIALFILGKRQTEQARADADAIQRKLIDKIDFSKLAEAKDYFIRIKDTERDIREDGKEKKYDARVLDRFVLESRIRIFSEILKFNKADLKKIEQFEKELAEIHAKEQKDNRRRWKIGAGAALVAGLSYGLYQIFKPSQKKEEEKK